MTSDLTIPYASHLPRQGPRVWAAGLIVLAGLAMVVLGGCFLIGVLMIVTNGISVAPPPSPLPAASVALMVVLYALAFASFVAAVVLIVVGLKGLHRVLSGT